MSRVEFCERRRELLQRRVFMVRLGFAVSAALLGLGLLTLRYWVGWRQDVEHAVVISGGAVGFLYDEKGFGFAGWRIFGSTLLQIFPWPKVERLPGVLHIWIPLWIPLVVMLMPTLWLWRRNGYVPFGCCQKCRYDLTGNVSGRCPECGTACGA